MSSSSWQRARNRTAQLWDRWTRPVVPMNDAVERSRAAFMASLYLALALVIGFVLPLIFTTARMEPRTIRTVMAIPVAIGLWGCYWLARRSHVDLSLWLLLLGVSALLFVSVPLTSHALGIQNLYFLVAVLLFAGLFLSIRATIILSVLHIAGMLMLPTLFPWITLEQLTIGPLSSHTLLALVTLMLAYYRQRLEEERRRQLAASEDRYRTVSELISDYAYSFRVESDGSVVNEWMTEAFHRVTGYTWQEVESAGLYMGMSEEEARRMRDDLQRTIGGEPTSGDYRIVRRDGQERWLHISRYPIWNAERTRVIRYYGVAQDVTERKQSEENRLEISLERERLEMAQRFVLAFSHDFRTSLAAIGTSAYLTERTLDVESRHKIQPKLDLIQRYVHHMAEQLDHLRSVSTTTPLNRIDVDLNRVMEELIAHHAPMARNRQQAIIFQPNPHVPWVRADPEELKQAVDHLLRNAINFTPDGGTILLRTTASDCYARIDVQDTGIGIAPNHLPHIFDPFYRVDSARSVNSGGVGLGLSIARMIVEAHGGTIKVESQPDTGSTFTVSLPLQVMEPQPVAEG